MAKKFALEVSSYDDLQPFESGAPERSLFNVINKLRGFLGGQHNGAVTVRTWNDLVGATGTVTLAAVQAGDTVTINGTALTATQARANGTATCASVSVADTVTVRGVVFTAAAAENLATGAFNQSSTDTVCATSLAACINASTNASLSGLVGAKSAAGVVTVYSIAAGTAGNAYTLASSNGGRLAVSGATLANGAAVANNQFDFAASDTVNAASLVTAIGASSTSLVSGHVTAANVAGVVTLTAKELGLAGNAITLASSNGGRLAVSGARLTGGTETLIPFTF